MNDLVDSKAKAYLSLCYHGPNPRSLTPVKVLFRKWSVSFNNNKLAILNKKAIYKQLFYP